MKHSYILLILSLGLFSFAFATYTTPWTLIKPSGRTPAARELHASTYNDGVWIYGGMSNQTSQGLQLFCDLQYYNVSANTWTLVDDCSRSDYKGPGKRYDMAYNQWRDCFLIFGGTNGSRARTTDTWCYNFTSGHWSELKVTFDPKIYKSDLEQTGLSAVVYQDNLIVSSNVQVFLLKLTAEPKTWTSKGSNGEALFLVGSYNYAMSFEESTGKVWMYAGKGNAGQPERHVNWIMTSNWTYVTPIILGGLPPLTRSKSAFSDGGECFLWGGHNIEGVTHSRVEQYPNTTWKFINDSPLTGLVWTVAPAVNNPRGRVGHTLVKSDSNEIYVFGGRTEYEVSGQTITYDELWTVSMATQLSLKRTTAKCVAPSSFADTPYQCSINGRDVNGRVTGDSTMAKNFKVVVTRTDNTTIDNTQVSYFESAFHFTIKVNTTGEYKVSITYLNEEIPNVPPFVIKKRKAGYPLQYTLTID